jgi:Zn finger protein HypA/HybF involved in hydrogenase expression
MLDSVKEKQKNTNLKRYGTISPTLNESVKNKQIQTCLDRYNTETPLESTTIKYKTSETYANNRLVYFRDKYPDLNIKELSSNVLTIDCPECKEEYQITSQLLNLRMNRYHRIPCLNCNPHSSYKYTSQMEIYNYIKNIYSGDIVLNDRKTLGGKELDILLPELNIAIEFNGTYWHQSKFKEPNYHYLKYKNCKQKGILLYQIWEFIYLENKEEIFKILKEVIENNYKGNPLYTKILGNELLNCNDFPLSLNDENKYLIPFKTDGYLIFNSGYSFLQTIST